MSKTFTYTKTTGHYYCQYSDDWEQDGVDFEYKVEDKDLLDEIVPMVIDEYFGEEKDFYADEKLWNSIKQKMKDLIYDNDLLDGLVERYEDTLKDIFYDEAIKAYSNM